MGNSDTRFVWVFNGARAQFPAGVFADLTLAESWVGKHRLTGVLTRYPVDSGAYDWSIKTGIFQAEKPEHSTPDFIQGFGCASFEHYHYEDGELA